MKILLISALMCLAGLANAANIQRVARDTETIIPTIVEEILKVELQSDLKKNSVVEAVENEPIVSSIKEETIVDPIASRTVEEGSVLAEEKKPEIVEIVAVKEIIPEPIQAIRDSEPLLEIVKKVEIVAIQENPVEKPVDNFRTESVPSVEQPSVEIIKETVVVEPVVELRQEPVAAVQIKEEEIVKPILRNVIKEEIPQVEELRNIAPVEMDAVKEILPEPVASSNIVEPVVEIEQQVKNVETPVLKEVKVDILAVTEIKTEAEIPAAIVPEIKLEEVKAKVEPLLSEVKEPLLTEVKEESVETEVKKVPEIAEMIEIIATPEIMPIVQEVVIDGGDSQIRQSDRPTIVQQVQDAFANVPLVGQIFNRNPADETVSDETVTRPNLIQAAQAAVQQAVQNTQNALQNVFAPTSNSVAAVDGAETTTRASPIAAVLNLASGAFQNVANIINPSRPTTTTTTPAKDEVKPTVVEESPVKADTQVKTVESAPQVVVEPEVVAQKESSETPKVVAEEKENLVKN